MARELIIGRNPEISQIVFPEQNVSRRHAKVSWDGSVMTIEDLESTYGTYVNGTQVEKRIITPNDEVTLGSRNGSRLYYDEVLRRMGVNVPKPEPHVYQKPKTPVPPQPKTPVTPKQNPPVSQNPKPPVADDEIDPVYSAKVRALETVYDDYQEALAEMTKASGNIMRLRMFPSLILGTISSVISCLVASDEKQRIIALVGSGVATLMMLLITNHICNQKMADSARERTRLNEQYELDYVCPECGQSWKGHSFAFLRRKGCCPYCKKKFRL